MPDGGFGSALWKNVQAIKLGQDGGIDAPVRASSEGIVVGVDRVAETDAAVPAPHPKGFWARLFRR
jgi:hypothetical protein